MSREVVLGLDAGTTSAKGVLVDRRGEVIASASSDPIVTAAAEPGASEQDPGEVWAALCQVIRRTTAEADDHEVGAIAIAAQSGSIVPIVEAGRPPSVVTWMDARSDALVSSWTSAQRGQVRAISGWSVSPGLGLSTISWLRAERPEIFDRTQRFASVDDFLAHRLTGAWITNPSNAAGMQLMDVGRLRWSEPLCSMAGIDPARLSTIGPIGGLLGRLHQMAAEETGLAPDIPVVIGGHDQACAALGLGVVEPGSAFLSAGTAWVLTGVVDRGDVGRLDSGLNLSPHVVADRWSASQNLGGIGAMIEWWRTESAVTHSDLTAAVDASTPGPDDPYFVPALSDPARTAWGRFVPDGNDRSLGAHTLAVIEAAVFEVRSAMIAMVESVGSLSGLTMVGGATQNDHLVQSLADAIGTPIIIIRGDASWPAIGVARLAAEWLGWPAAPPDLGRSSVQPDPSASARHDHRFAAYRNLTRGATP